MTTNDAPSPGESAAARLVPLAALMVVMAAVILGSLTIRSFNQALEPEFSKRSQLIGTIIQADLQHALDVGIPLEYLSGTTSYLEKVLADFPEVATITLRSVDQSVVSRVQAGKSHTQDGPNVDRTGDQPSSVAAPGLRFNFSLLAGSTVVGEIIVEIDPAYVERQFRGVLLDILVVILVAILLVFEITLGATATSVRKPLDQLYMLLEQQARGDFSQRIKRLTGTSLGRIAARFSDHADDLNARYRRLLSAATTAATRDRLKIFGRQFGLSSTEPLTFRLVDPVDIRLPLFVFAAANELSKPFLPQYVHSMITGETWVSEAIVVSLPLIAYLAGLVALSPFAGFLAERVSPRRAFLFALVPVGASQLGLWLSSSVEEIVLWMGITGLGYALATIAAQDYALTSVAPNRRTRAAASFVTVVLGGTFAGTAIGGVLADRVGQSNVFLIGAFLVAGAGVVALGMLSEKRPDPTNSQAARLGIRGLLSACLNGQFLSVLVGIAIPANVLMSAFLWYLVPLMLAERGFSPADIGRALMLYYLIVVLLASGAARLADRHSCTSTMLTISGIGSGFALLLASWDPDFWSITFAIIASGIAHAGIRAPLIGYVVALSPAEATQQRGAMLAALRTCERAGAILGLGLTAFLAGEAGYAAAVRITGISVMAGAALFGVVAASRRLSKGKPS